MLTEGHRPREKSPHLQVQRAQVPRESWEHPTLSIREILGQETKGTWAKQGAVGGACRAPAAAARTGRAPSELQVWAGPGRQEATRLGVTCHPGDIAYSSPSGPRVSGCER